MVSQCAVVHRPCMAALSWMRVIHSSPASFRGDVSMCKLPLAFIRLYSVHFPLTVSWATNRTKHPRSLASTPPHAVYLTLNPSPLTFTFSPTPHSVSLSVKPLLKL
ncbi:hypothetical protein Q8A73_004663 [Channa argus]|nr:hypothetical protein Q8A73_004663 [Channa argus]